MRRCGLFGRRPLGCGAARQRSPERAECRRPDVIRRRRPGLRDRSPEIAECKGSDINIQFGGHSGAHGLPKIDLLHILPFFRGHVLAGKKSFLIKTLNGLALTVEGLVSGSAVRLRRRTGHISQRWYDDPDTGTIRSKLNDLCLDVQGSNVVVSAFRSGDVNQQWARIRQGIRNRQDLNRCIHVWRGGRKHRDALVVAGQFTGSHSDLWQFPIVVPRARPGHGKPGIRDRRKYFVITSELTGLSLAVEGSRTRPMTPVVTAQTTHDDNQLWYNHWATGTIRSKLNDLCLDIEFGKLVVNNFQRGDHRQLWVRFRDAIINRLSFTECLEIKDSSEKEGALVVTGKFKEDDNQSWSFSFLDEEGDDEGDNQDDDDHEYYRIQVQGSGLALAVQGTIFQKGAFVVTAPIANENSQLWYDDEDTGTIRSRWNDYCLDVQDGRFVVSPFDEDRTSQLFIRNDNRIISFQDSKKVLEIQGGSFAAGAFLFLSALGKGRFQLWDFNIVIDLPSPPPSPPPSPVVEPPPPPPPRKEFYIVSAWHGLVAEVKDGNAAAGAQLVVNPKKAEPDKSQLFYLDDAGFIRSALNDLALTSASPNPITLQPATDNPDAQWRWDGKKVINAKNEVLDITGRVKDPGTTLIAFTDLNQFNQEWNKEVI